MTHTAPKTASQFKSFCKQKSTQVIWQEGDTAMLRRPNSTQQWSWNGSKWVLSGFS